MDATAADERKTVIVNARIPTASSDQGCDTIVIEGGTIAACGARSDLSVPPDATVIDAEGRRAVPGLIDLHIHGLLGHDSMGEGLTSVIHDLPRFGVTSFLATTITLPQEETFEALTTMGEILKPPPSGARCLGIHLEGPFLSPTQPGMATAEWFEPLSWDAFQAYQQAARGLIRMLTFALENAQARAVIPRLLAARVIPSMGHTTADFADVAEAVDLGLAHATHTFNAMAPFHHRRPGAVGAVLFFHQIVAQLIADGVHVHPAAMTVLIRAKGIDHVTLVSDASPMAGLPEGVYEWEHKTIIIQDGKSCLEDGTIAGAHALLDAGVRTLVTDVGLPLRQALVPATIVPARVLGLSKGRLAPGHDADILLLDDDLRPVLTLVEGQVAYSTL